MSWSDVKALEQIKKLRDFYHIKVFIETGTFMGVNAAVHANNFDTVCTIEKNLEYYVKALSKTAAFSNVWVVGGDSAEELGKEEMRCLIAGLFTPAFIYLDAHFYDAALPPEERWVILRELKALRSSSNVVLAIHDFDNGLGHLTYDGQPMNFDFLRSALLAVNPNFYFYTNTKETCDIITKERVAAGEVPNLVLDDVTADNLDYAWGEESKTRRGILYCTPTALDLSKFELTEIK